MQPKISKWMWYAFALALLVVAGFVRNWYHPAPGVTVGPARPAVVVAPPTRLLERKTVAETVTRDVVRRVPTSPKVRQQIEHDFGVELSTAPPAAAGQPPAPPEPGKVDLLTEVDLPALPAGGTAIATLDAGGRTEIRVLPRKQKFFALGGVRETGVFYEVVRGAAGIYHQQDLLRSGQVVWSAHAFASVPAPPLVGGLPGDRRFNYGLELRAGVRW